MTAAPRPGIVSTVARTAVLPRRRVADLLSTAARHRVTLVVAGGGFGKTTALRELATGRRGAWLAVRQADRAAEVLTARISAALGMSGLPEAGSAVGAEDRRSLAESRAGLLCEGAERAGEDLMLVLDDVEHLHDADSATQLLRAMCLQAPPGLHLVLCGRALPPLGLGRARGQGDVLDVDAGDLAFTVEETAALLSARLGPGADDLAPACWSLTTGWAAALQLTLDRLERLEPRARPAALAEWERHRGAGWRDFARELVAAESPRARRILATASVTGIVDADLLDGLGMAVEEDDLDGLAHRGLLVRGGDTGAQARTVNPVLADVAAQQLDATDAQALRRDAVAWLEAAGRLEEALECCRGGAPTATRAFLRRQGYALVRRGSGGRVAEVLDQVRTNGEPDLECVRGAALQASGDWDGALEVFAAQFRRAPDGVLPAAVVWRYGALRYLRGDGAGALVTLSTGSATATGADAALIAGWRSATLWGRGDLDGAAAAAATAMDAAQRCGDAGAQATAHIALALVAAARGDREANDAEYRRALHAATAAGDSIHLARIHANLSSRAVEEGEYADAVRHADLALREGAGHRFFAALALANKAEALMCTGLLDEARAALDRALDGYAELGSLRAAVPRALLGVLHRERGDLVRARICFEHAVRLAEQSDDVHALVTALGGLARTIADDDPAAARDHAARAVAAASSLELPRALCAGAWVELGAGDAAAAADLARRAEAAARRTRDRAALAESLELAWAAAPAQERLLRDALAIWEDIGNPLAVLRVRLALALRHDARDEVVALRGELTARGAGPDVGLPALLSDRPAAAREPALVAITTLGRFRLVRGAEPVPVGAWKSRKARDLLKILVAHHDRPLSRDAAAEALWPDQPPLPLANRLSVALSTVRRVLDPDRAHPSDHFVSADAGCLALRTDRVEVDVVRFAALARDGIGRATERPDAAWQLLRQAEELYTGDFLEEDRYEDWAVDCREQTRATAQTVSRLLARLAAARGDEDTACHHLWRLLERDPYDEQAWLALLGANLRLHRPGQARTLYGTYTRRMAELDVAPLPLADARHRRA